MTFCPLSPKRKKDHKSIFYKTSLQCSKLKKASSLEWLYTFFFMKCKLIPRHSFVRGPLERQNTRSRLLQNTKNCKRNIQKKPQKKRGIYIKKKLFFSQQITCFRRYLWGICYSVQSNAHKRKEKEKLHSPATATRLQTWQLGWQRFIPRHTTGRHTSLLVCMYMYNTGFFFFSGGKQCWDERDAKFQGQQ